MTKDTIGRSWRGDSNPALHKLALRFASLASLVPLWAAVAQAAPLDTSEVIGRARNLRQTDHGKAAIELLERARQLAPDDEALAVFLAWTYWSLGNRNSALKTAVEFSGEREGACAARATATWLHIQMAHLAQAENLLSRPGCNELPEDRARIALLRTRLAKLQKKSVEVYVTQAQTGRLYAEDAPLLEQALDEHHPGRLPWVATRLDIAAGWTSNGLAGSPVDVTSPVGGRGSMLTVADARARVVYPMLANLRSVVTAQARVFELFSSAARDLSYEQPSLRAGLLWGRLPPKVLVSYALDAVRLHSGDRYTEGPLWFSEAHRVEWESQLSQHWMLFGGSGYRRFRDMARSRFEAEQGVVTSWPIRQSLRVLGAMSARWQQAHSDGYDLVGGTAISELSWALGSRTELRGTLSASVDYYPHSQNYFPRSPMARRDLLERGTAALWQTIGRNWQVIPSYELTTRASTSEPYSFTDHRLLFRVEWNFDTNQYAVVSKEGRVPMEWSSDERHNPARDESRVQDLVRQDDAVRRGSSCLK